MKTLRKIYFILVLIFLYAPIIIMAVFSFNDSKLRGTWKGFTLKWYEELFSSQDILNALKYTLLCALLATVISTFLGTIAAIGISGMGGLREKYYMNLNILPILNPDIVTAVSLMSLYGVLGMDLGFTTMLISHIVFSTPYVVLSVLPKLDQLDANLGEAALDLGATPMYALRKVIIPEIMPGIITGALIVFTLSIDDFVISFFNTGNGVTNLSIEIYTMAKLGVKPSMNALSTIMFVFMMLLLLIMFWRREKTRTEEREDY